MRTIILGLAVAVLAAAGGRAQTIDPGSPYAIQFRNATCGAVTLSIGGDVPCSDLRPGCNLPVARGLTAELALTFRARASLLRVAVQGACPAQASDPPSTMAGECMLPLDRMFPYNGVDITRGLLDPLDPDPDDPPVISERDYAVNRPYLELPNAVEVDLELAECDTSAGARRESCAVSCRRLGDPLRDDAPTRDLGD